MRSDGSWPRSAMHTRRPRCAVAGGASARGFDPNQEIKMLRFYIPNMTCGGCARSVTKALLCVDPQARIEAERAGTT